MVQDRLAVGTIMHHGGAGGQCPRLRGKGGRMHGPRKNRVDQAETPDGARDLQRQVALASGRGSRPVPELIRNLIDRVLGDRQRHEAAVVPKPAGDADLMGPSNPIKSSAEGEDTDPASGIRLRIYVAARHGQYHLVDDRAESREDLSNRIEIIRSEFGGDVNEQARIGSGAIESIRCASECKGEMLYLLAEDNKRRSRCDYVAFVDDDIDVKASDLLRGAEQAAARGSSLFQLQLTDDSHAVWPILKRRPDCDPDLPTGFAEQWSQIPFIEIMAPVIAQTELDNGLLEVLRPFKSGFGWDFYLLPCLQEIYTDFRPGLFRGASMHHGRAVQTSNQSRFSNGLTALDEEELIRAAIILTLATYSKEENFPGRQQFLSDISKHLEELCQQSCEPVLAGVAAALRSISERYWQCRLLETKLRGKTAEIERLTEQIKQLKVKTSEIERDSETRLQNAEQEIHRERITHEQTKKCLQDEIRGLHSLSNRQHAYIEELHRSVTWKLGRALMLPARIAASIVKRLKTGGKGQPRPVD